MKLFAILILLKGLPPRTNISVVAGSLTGKTNSVRIFIRNLEVRNIKKRAFILADVTYLGEFKSIRKFV